ncbi:MAG: hypothetical protein N2035_08350, partial [Chthoniobacterales bacterium]|nr:hypothetical protein [Chthoniobacterales bacterium]
LAYGRFLGKAAAYWAALAMALSPAYIFYARYSIHESWFAFFNILFVLGILGLSKRGTSTDLRITFSGLTGMILTKETYIIHVGSLLLTLLLLLAWNRLFPPRGPSVHFPPQKWSRQDLLPTAAFCIFLIVFFYSGNFYCWESLHGLWKTHTIWIRTGLEASGHAKKTYDLFGGPLNWYWLALMLRYEWPAILGLAACFWCLTKVRSPLRLLAIYGAGLLLAYSLISYKTPWCIIAFLWPFHLLAGSLVASFRRLPSREIAAAALALAIGFSAHRTIQLNFLDYDNEREPYVYVQTYRDINRFLHPIFEAAKTDPAMFGMRGEILLASYYPLPWILGDFWNIAWFGEKNWPSVLTGDFIVGDLSKRHQILDRLRGNYFELQFRFRDAQETSVAFFREETFPNLRDQLPRVNPSLPQQTPKALPP